MVAGGLKHGLMTERAKTGPGAAKKSESSHVGGSSSKSDKMAGMDHGGMRMSKSSATSTKPASVSANAHTNSNRVAKSENHDTGTIAMTGGADMQADVTQPQLVTIT